MPLRQQALDLAGAKTVALGFFFSILVVLSGTRFVDYLAPLFLIIWLFVSSTNFRLQIIRKVLPFIAGLVVVAVIRAAILDSGFSWTGFVLALLTFSGAFFFFLDFPRPLAVGVLHYVRKVSIVVLIFEGGLGLLQALVFSGFEFDLASGDKVVGTLGGIHGYSAGAGESTSFALAISFFVAVTCATWKRTIPSMLAIGLGVSAWWLSANLHTLMLFLAAQCFSVVLIVLSAKRINKKIVLLPLAAVLVFGILWNTFMPKNFASLETYFTEIIDITPSSRSPKIRLTYSSVVELPRLAGWQPLLGMGPGNWSSRASLFLSGDYALEDYRPSLANPLAAEYVFDEVAAFSLATSWEERESSAVRFPAYSWLTLYAENGIIIFILLLIYLKRRIAVYSRVTSRADVWNYFWGLTLLLYLVLLGFAENYWEWTGVFFIGCFLHSLIFGKRQLADS